MLKRILRKFVQPSISSTASPNANPLIYSDITDFEADLIERVKNYTMTSNERIVSLIRACEYIIENNIDGEFVECGVWRGGSSMVMSTILKLKSVSHKRLFLYDTFDGMSEPTEQDVSCEGDSASVLLQTREKNTEDFVWAFATIEDVRQNILSTGFDVNKLNLIKGKVEETIPRTIPDSISLLRLDTDWYESTYHELKHLFPRLVSGGVIIIDDYGHWQGAKKAVDQYFKENNIKILLNRIDYTGRIAIKL